MTKPAATIFCLSLALGAAGAPRAAAEAGLTAAPALNAPMGARSAAMGQASAAVPGSAESLNYNPGALAFTPGSNIFASYLSGFDYTGHGFMAAPLKFGAFVFTPGYLYFNGGSMNLNLSDGTTGKVTAEDDRTAYASGAWRPVKRLGLGATLKHTRIVLAETASASALNYDFGALYVLDGGLSLGASYMNSGGGFKFEEKADPAPAVRRLGAAYRLELTPPNLLDPSTDLVFCEVLFTADWAGIYRERGYYQAGAELKMGMPMNLTLDLRAGYLLGRAAEGMTFGLGLGRDKWTFGYSLGAAKEINTRQQASLGYKFN
ncbi:MAG: hypothetical protein A2285_06910 [Elusimicrobia bacterium RIFOXYA12_FULL_57_11]|nr:MAG: hypothetical protein A2285_06910 [Elusimicrobia bacterium RIFOXYA12_FULL_57_11]